MLETLGQHVPLGEAVGHVGYAITLAAYLVRDVVLLRALVVVACGVMMWYFVALAGPGIAWTPTLWMMILLAVNLVWIAVLLRERRSVSLSPKEQELHETLFREFTALEFMKLVRSGTWQTLPEGHEITRKGEPVEDLTLLSNGAVHVETGHGQPIELRDGAFIGEMSFLSNRPATATVRTSRPTECLSWRQADLNGLLRRNPSMRSVVMSVIGADLTSKLAVPLEQRG